MNATSFEIALPKDAQVSKIRLNFFLYFYYSNSVISSNYHNIIIRKNIFKFLFSLTTYPFSIIKWSSSSPLLYLYE
jgi:hypothetical protein